MTDYELDEDVEEDLSIPADPSVRNFSFTLVDGKIYFRENSRMTPFDVSATAQNRIKGMIPIRDSVRRLLEMQTENYPDDVIKAEQERLNTLYDNYTKKYGLINSRANNSAFSMDSSYSLISSLEVIDEEGNLERKADIFTKRTIRPHEPIHLLILRQRRLLCLWRNVQGWIWISCLSCLECPKKNCMRI